MYLFSIAFLTVEKLQSICIHGIVVLMLVKGGRYEVENLIIFKNFISPWMIDLRRKIMVVSYFSIYKISRIDNK